MELRTLYDIYRCPYCKAIAARGNYYCRGCGVRFTQDDVKKMERDIRSPVGALPWNTRDRFRCLQCKEFVSIQDKYCRSCGDEFDAKEKNLMRLKLAELAKRNTPALIGLTIFVIFVIWISIQVV